MSTNRWFPRITFTRALFFVLVLPATHISAPQVETTDATSASSGAERLPIKPLKTTLETKPGYTEEARKAGVEGTAVIYAEITKDGVAENLRVLRSLGYGLDEEASKAVAHWRFEPYQENGQVRRAATYVRVNFRLDRQLYDTRVPTTGANEVLQVGTGVTAPRILSRVAATYTEEARIAKLSGTIVLFLEVSASGTVENVVVLHKMGKGMDESAVHAIKQWKFAPAVKDGLPVPVIMTAEMNFQIE